MSPFENKHIVISGGSSGLGLALAHALAREGAQLTLIARNPHKLSEAAAALRGQHQGLQLRTVALDVCDAEATATAIVALAGEAGGIDVLINNAGILREGYFERTGNEVFREIMDTNFHGAIHLTRAALPFLKARQGGLVNVASVAGLTGSFGYTAYSAAKHALVGFTECLHYELKPQGVRVHLVCPAEFDSPMVDALDQYRTVENREHTLTIPKTGVEVIVRDTLRGIRNRKYLIVPGTAARLATMGLRLFPGLSRRIGEQRIGKVYRGPAADAT